MFKKYLGILLLLIFIAAGTAAQAVTIPANSAVNPSNETLYLVDNSVPRILVYDKSAGGWTNSGTTITLPAPAYGLVASSGHLYVSISNGSSSDVRDYTLDASQIPDGSFTSMTGAGWIASSSPAGMEINTSENRLFVADQGGRIKVFNTSDHSMVTQTFYPASLYDVAITSDKVYLSNRAEVGKVIVYNYNYSTDALTPNTVITTDLKFPTYLKTYGDKLYVAVNDPNSNDLKVYNTTDDTLAGTISSGVTGGYGWNSFDLNASGSMLYFKKAGNYAEDTNTIYSIGTAQISGGGTFTASAMSGIGNVGQSDGLVIANDSMHFALTDSSDGSVEIRALSEGNTAPHGGSNLQQLEVADGTTPIPQHGETSDNYIVVSFDVRDDDPGDAVTPYVQYRLLNDQNGPPNPWQVVELDPVPTIPASWVNVTATIPAGAEGFANGNYEWSVYVVDQQMEQSGTSDAWSNNANGSSDPLYIDFIVNSAAGQLQIVETYPADLATDIPLNAPIVVKFNQEVDINAPFNISIAGFSGTLYYTWSEGNTRLAATHEAENFSTSTQYTVNVSAQSMSAQPLSGDTDFVFTTSSDPNRLAPYITNTNPVDDVTGVAINQPVIVDFNRAVDEGTLATTSPVAFDDINWDNGSTQVTLGHSANFSSNATQVIEVTNADGINGVGLIPGPVPNPFNFDTGNQISDFEPPAGIEDLVAAVGSATGTVDLTWTAVGDDGNTGTATSYKIVYSYTGPIANETDFTNATVYPQALSPQAAGGSENLTMTGLNAAAQIWVSVKAVDEVPQEGPISNYASTIVKNFVPAPTITRVYPNSGPNNIANHIIVEGTDMWNNFILQIGTNPPTQLTGIHWYSENMIGADIPAGIAIGDYEITITAPGGTYDDAAHSNPNNNFELINQGTDTDAPAIVTNLNASDSEDSQVTLTWTNPADGDLREVIVRRKLGSYPANHTDGDQAYQTMIPAPGDAVNVVDSPLVNGTEYFYAVFSRDTSDNWNDTVTAGNNADTGTPNAGSQDPITNVTITRDGDNPGDGITITWNTNPAGLGVDIYVLTCQTDVDGNYTSYFSTTAANWGTAVETNNTSGTYSIQNSVGQGTAVYYKLIPTGNTLQDTDLETNVAGKFDISVGPSATEPAKFFISLPLEVSDTSLVSVIGAQVEQNDIIFSFDIDKMPTAGSMYDTANGWTQFIAAPAPINDMEPGYAYGYSTTTSRFITIVGMVRETDLNRSLEGGNPLAANWVANPYPSPIAILDAGLNNSTFSPTAGMGSMLSHFDADAVPIGGTDGMSFHYDQNEWRDGLNANPSPLQLIPGRGYMFIEPTIDPFTWDLARPY
jgi:Bacterial Ig-like domain/IPT/TIG domain